MDWSAPRTASGAASASRCRPTRSSASGTGSSRASPSSPRGARHRSDVRAADAGAPGLTKLPDVADWFSRPVWRETPLPPPDAAGRARRWLVFAADDALGDGGQSAPAASRRTTSVRRRGRATPSPAWTTGEYALARTIATAYAALLADLAGGAGTRSGSCTSGRSAAGRPQPAWPRSWPPGGSAGAGLLQPARAGPGPGRGGAAQRRCTSAWSTDGLQPAGASRARGPERATVLGPVQGDPAGVPGLTCQSIDVAAAGGDAGRPPRLERRRQIVAEVAAAPAERGRVRLPGGWSASARRGGAVRGARRERAAARRSRRPPAPRLRAARRLPRSPAAWAASASSRPSTWPGTVAGPSRPGRPQRTARRGRSGTPGWPTHTGTDATSRRIRQVQALEALGAEVMSPRPTSPI